MRLAIALGIVYLVWGSTYLAIAVADRTLPPLLMLSVRFGLAGGLLYAWSAWRGDLSAARLGRREWTAAAVVGGLLLFVDTGGMAWAAGSAYGRVAPLPQAPFLSAAMQMLCAAALLGIAGAAMGEVGRVHPEA